MILGFPMFGMGEKDTLNLACSVCLDSFCVSQMSDNILETVQDIRHSGWAKKVNPIFFTLVVSNTEYARKTGFTDILIYLWEKVCKQIVLLL